MSTQTTKLNLTKPSADEAVDIAVINANMDKIDAHAHAAADVSSGTLDLARLPTVSVAKGGTGKTSHAANSVLVGNGSSALKNVSTASGALYATGANAAPSFGPLPIAQGGTGKTTAADARAALGAASATDLKAVQDSISKLSISNAKDRKAVYFRYDSGHILCLLFVPSSKLLYFDVSEDGGNSFLGRKLLAEWA